MALVPLIICHVYVAVLQGQARQFGRAEGQTGWQACPGGMVGLVGWLSSGVAVLVGRRECGMARWFEGNSSQSLQNKEFSPVNLRLI